MGIVLHINGGGDLGGGKSHLVALLPRLRQMGVDAQLLVFSSGVLEEECRQVGVPVHCLDRPALVSPGLLLSLTSFLRKHRPVLVHTHGGRASFYGRLAASMARLAPVLTTVHSHLQLDHDGRWKNSIFTAADRLTWPMAECFIAVSSDLRQGLIKRGIPSEKIRVIPNGIGPCPVPRDPAVKQEPGVPLLCSVGRFVPIKGFSVLLEAAAILLHGGCRFRLMLVGDGPERRKLEQLARKLRIDRHVIFTGYRHNACALLPSCDAFVLSSHMEGLPIVVLEAMAASIPVVATHVGGLAEMITSGENGLLVPPNNPGKLAEAIRRILTEEPAAKDIGLAGHRWFLAHGTAERMAERTVSCYEEFGYVRG